MTTMNNASSIREALQYSDDADQVEFDAIKSGVSTVGRGVYDEQVSGVLDDLGHDLEIAQQLEPWQRADLIRDDSVGGVHGELLRRENLLKNSYPFELKGGTLIHHPSASKMYEFMLSVSTSPDLSSGLYVRLPRAFERISATLVASYFGPNAKSLHVGFPRDNGASFTDVWANLNAITNEWRWNPENAVDSAKVRDEGCDFVVWLEPSDGRRIGQLFLLGQCACGNNWHDKYDDLRPKTLGKWFHPMTLVDPVRTFTTPWHVPDQMLREGSREAGLFFDRARLCSIAETAPQALRGVTTKERLNALIDLVFRAEV